MTPERQNARDFLAHAAKRNHGIEWHRDEAGKTVIDKACPAVLHNGETAVELDETQCTCGATRHNLLVERSLNTLTTKERRRL